MKKFVMVLALISSASAIAQILPKQCPNPAKPTIETHEPKVAHKNKFAIVRVYGETARSLYSQVAGDETVITESGKDLIIKSQGEIHCFRQFKTIKKQVCNIFECEIGAIQ